MRKGNLLFTLILAVFLLILAKTATLTPNPRTMGLLALVFFSALIFYAMK